MSYLAVQHPERPSQYHLYSLIFWYNTVEELEVCAPVRKKPRFDIDRDSAITLSVITDEKSTVSSGVSLKLFVYIAFWYNYSFISMHNRIFKTKSRRSWRSWRSWIMNRDCRVLKKHCPSINLGVEWSTTFSSYFRCLHLWSRRCFHCPANERWPWELRVLVSLHLESTSSRVTFWLRNLNITLLPVCACGYLCQKLTNAYSDYFYNS